MNNFKIEDRIKTIIMFSCIIHGQRKKKAHLLNASFTQAPFTWGCIQNYSDQWEMFHHPQSKPSHSLLAPFKQMDKMKLTQEKHVAHNHTGHHSVPVIRKRWNQQQCFLCFRWALSKGGSSSLAHSSPAPKSQVLWSAVLTSATRWNLSVSLKLRLLNC